MKRRAFFCFSVSIISFAVQKGNKRIHLRTNSRNTDKLFAKNKRFLTLSQVALTVTSDTFLSRAISL